MTFMNRNRIKIDIETTAILKVALVLLFLWLVVLLKDIIVIFIFAFILQAALETIVRRLEKKKVPRPLAIFLVFSGLIGALVFFIQLIIPPLAGQVKSLVFNWPYLIERISNYLSGIGINLNLEDLKNIFGANFATAGASGVLSTALGVFSGILGLISVLVLSLYLLIQKNSLENFISLYVPLRHKDKVIRIYQKITQKMSHWIRGQAFLSLIIGVVDYIGLSIIGVNYALILAIVAAFTETLPVIGPVFAGGLAALVALSDSPTKALWVILFYIVVQQFENHVLVPQVMKKALGLSPVVIIITLLVGAKLMGIWGILLAVPVGSAISVVFQEVVKSQKTT